MTKRGPSARVAARATGDEGMGGRGAAPSAIASAWSRATACPATPGLRVRWPFADDVVSIQPIAFLRRGGVRVT